MTEVIAQLYTVPEGVELKRRVSYLIWHQILFGHRVWGGVDGFNKNLQFKHPLRFIAI